MKKGILFLMTAVLASAFVTDLQAQGDPSTLDKVRQARYVATTPKCEPLGLLHYSDLHGDDFAAGRLLESISDYGAYIDAVVCTGDVVHYFADATKDYANDYKWWRKTGLAEKSLFVLGNHDGAVGSDARGRLEGSSDWDFKGKAWEFDTYFGDYSDILGFKLPDGFDDPSSPYYKSCFWYKDFEAARIRIIGIDNIHYNDSFHYLTGEQEEWLAARLAETLSPGNPAEGYSVIILSHYPIDDFEGDNETWDESSHKFLYNSSPRGGRVMDGRTGSVVNFHTYSRESLTMDKRFALRKKFPLESAKYGYEKGDVNPFAEIIRTWMNDGGKFIAWLCGHCHSDLMFYPEKYPDILCIAVDQAGNLRGTSLADRPEGADSRFCANYYGIDTQHGLFKVVRLGGLKRDRFLVAKDVLCYDYVNRKVIFE